MNNFKRWGLTALAAAMLVACGGGDNGAVPGSGSTAGAPTTKGTFTSVVSFGDSLSDVGTYAPATSLSGNGAAPYLGGKFTTNSANSTVWVENIAATLGLAITPAEVGYAGQRVSCPAEKVNAAYANTCTGYGQGGARVTDPVGIGNSDGALTVPMVTQIANHLTRFKSFKSTDLILVYGGNNDVLTQFGIFVAKAQAAQAAAAAGTITADAANNAVFEAQTAAQYAIKAAALELSGYVKDQILAKGGKYVAVMALSDIADTPFGATVTSASARGVLTDLSRLFNMWLRDGLTDQPVQIVDTFAIFKDVTTNPAAYGMTNIKDVACSAAKIEAITKVVKSGSSLFCNATAGVPYNGLTTGADVNTWFFADGVHPTTGGHKAVSAAFLAKLKSFGWL